MKFIIMLLAMVYGHNWIHSRSRAIKASTLQPAPPKPLIRTPHLRVGKGDEFHFEWATGHSGSTYYFVILPAEHEDKLGMHTAKNLEEYIKGAPKSGEFSDPSWEKIHVSCSFAGQCAQNKKKVNTGKDYAGQLAPGDDLYVNRPESWGDLDATQFRYKRSDLAKDVRVSYDNKKYHWIESVHRFQVSHTYPKEWDVAKFVIDGRRGSDEYVIHMVWRGYRDVIDVDLLSETSPDIYGSPSDATEWKKENHCQYLSYKERKKTPCYFVDGSVDGVQQCLDTCERKGMKKCSAVNVVPLYNPPLVVHDTVNVPWNPKCEQPGNTEYSGDTFVCYGLTPVLSKTANKEVDSPWTVIVDDPEDAIFYSTCYRRDPTWNFIGLTSGSATQMPEVSWKVGEECISCSTVAKNSVVSFDEIAVWNIADECEKCD